MKTKTAAVKLLKAHNRHGCATAYGCRFHRTTAKPLLVSLHLIVGLKPFYYICFLQKQWIYSEDSTLSYLFCKEKVE